jgi:hypothetical protein
MYFFIKFAILTGGLFSGKRPLDLTLAEGAGHKPAGSSGTFPLVQAIKNRVVSRRAHTQLLRPVASGFPAALHVFPAIDFF